MSPLVFDVEVAVEIPASAAFHGLLRLHDVLLSSGDPNVKSAALVEGDGGVGSVITYDFVDVKELVEFLDKEAFEVTNKITEGLGIGTKLNSITNSVKVLPTASGSVFKIHAEYLPLLGGAGFKAEDLEAAKAKTVQLFKAIEAVFKAVPRLTFDEEVAIDGVPPVKMFDGLVGLYKIANSIAPTKVKSAGLVKGNGGVGSIIQMDLAEEGIVKDRVELLDKQSLEFKISSIEGFEIGTKHGSKEFHFKVSPAPTGTGSICKVHGEYIAFPGANFNDDDLNISREKITGMIKAVGAYLAAQA